MKDPYVLMEREKGAGQGCGPNVHAEPLRGTFSQIRRLQKEARSNKRETQTCPQHFCFSGFVSVSFALIGSRSTDAKLQNVFPSLINQRGRRNQSAAWKAGNQLMRLDTRVLPSGVPQARLNSRLRRFLIQEFSLSAVTHLSRQRRVHT